MAQPAPGTEAHGSARHPVRRARFRGWSNYLFIAPAILFISLTMIYPILENLRMSLFDVNVATFLSDTAPFVGLDNYAGSD